MKKIILLLAVTATAFASQSQTPDPPTRQPLAPTARPLPHSKHSFIVIAHRGDHTHVPENPQLPFGDGPGLAFAPFSCMSSRT